MKKSLLIVAAATCFFTMSPAFADDEYNVATGLTAAGAPLGFHGVDPVAFVELENRVDGSATYTSVHDGVAYYFSSKENMKKFDKAPESYMPQNGGFCTYGVSVAKKFDGDPQYATVRDGKLYVFLNEEIYRAYQADKEAVIRKASTNWPKIRSESASKL